MSLVHPHSPRIKYVEDILQKTGWGPYYNFLVGFTCMSCFTNATTLLCMYFVIPLSSCDIAWKEDDLITMHIWLTLGKTFGGYLLCNIADNNGKKCMIPKTFMIMFVGCFIIAFANSLYALYLSAFILGSGLQANTIVVKIYLAEILPASKRGFYLVLSDLCWTLGYFTTPGCIYLIHNFATITHQGMDMRITLWRAIFTVCGGLSLIMACASALLEESPRFLLFKRRYITAQLLLKQFYAINKSKYSETLEINSQHLFDIVHDYGTNLEAVPASSWSYLKTSVKIAYRMITLLLRRKFIGTILLLIFCQLLLLNGHPDNDILLTKLLKFPNQENVSGLDLLKIVQVKGEHCTVVEKGLFDNFFLLSVNIFVGQIVLMCIIDRIGRKIPIFLDLVACAVGCMVLAYIRTSPLGAIAASVFTMGISMVQSILFIVATESVPTAVRATAVSTMQLHRVIISCLIYKYLYMSCQYFFTTLGFVSLGVSMATLLLPELKGRPMVE